MIIVTGGAGFIGSNILAALQEKGEKDLVVCDWLGEGDKWKNIAKRELFGLVDPQELPEFLIKHAKEIKAVIHMGAISATTETDVDLIVRSNFNLSTMLADWCAENNKQFIYASSAATYGAGENGFEDRQDLEYLNALRPLNPYGWSKAAFDRKLLRDVASNRPVPRQWVGLKFFNVYGPNEYHKGGQKSVVAHIFPEIMADHPVGLFKSYRTDYKDGWQLRDFVWVGDCVNVVLWFLEHPEVSGIFNVGSGEARSFYDLALSTFKAAGKKAQIIFKEMPQALRDKYQYYTKANLTKLREVGYDRPATSLEDGIALYVSTYLNTSDPYR